MHLHKLLLRGTFYEIWNQISFKNNKIFKMVFVMDFVEPSTFYCDYFSLQCRSNTFFYVDEEKNGEADNNCCWHINKFPKFL